MNHQINNINHRRRNPHKRTEDKHVYMKFRLEKKQGKRGQRKMINISKHAIASAADQLHSKLVGGSSRTVNCWSLLSIMKKKVYNFSLYKSLNALLLHLAEPPHRVICAFPELLRVY